MTAVNLSQPLQSPLSRRMLVWTLTTVVAVTLLESAAQLYFNYSEDVYRIRQNIGQELRHHLPPLSNGLYHNDDQKLRIELESLLQDPDIAYAAVWSTADLQHVRVQRGENRLPYPLYQSYRLVYRLPAGQPLPVGFLQVVVNLAEAHKRLWRNALVNISFNGLTILAVSLAILLLTHIGVVRYLHLMARHAADLDLNRLDRPLQIRRLFRRQRPDEIDQVVYALNDLQSRLREDILKRQQIERRLQQAQKLESLGTLAGGVAHDINNVLGIILGQTELALASLPPDTPARERLELSIQGVDRAKRIVHQVLAFSRRSDVRRRPLDIARAVQDALLLLHATIPKTIELRSDIENRGDVIIADPTEIQQVLMNLCGNAAQAMPQGGTLFVNLLRVEISTEDLDAKIGAPPGSYSLLTVRDTGHGMDHETQERVFEPYFTTKEIGKGTGLGLSVVHGIVSALKGTITVHSAPGAGTTFRIFLPRAILDEDSTPPAVARPVSEHLLLVDDDTPLLESLGHSLEKIGYRLTRCVDGEQALQALKHSPREFDALITDLTMPRLSGWDLAVAARKIRQNLPIILCLDLGESVHEKQNDGSEFYLVSKPVLRDELIHALRLIFDTKNV